MPVPGLNYTDEQLFQLTNLVLPAWLALALAPTNKLTHVLVLLVTIILSALYAALVVPQLMKAGGLDAFKDMTSLPGVIKLLRDPGIAFASWVHFSVGDLWVGRWIALDAKRRRIPLLLTVPILGAAMLLGPIGLGFYLLFRAIFPERDAKLKIH